MQQTKMKFLEVKLGHREEINEPGDLPIQRSIVLQQPVDGIHVFGRHPDIDDGPARIQVFQYNSTGAATASELNNHAKKSDPDAVPASRPLFQSLSTRLADI